MKRLSVKIAAGVLSAAVLLSAAACDKMPFSGEQTKDSKKVTADMPWYDSRYITVQQGFDEAEHIDSVMQNLIGLTEDYFVVRTTIDYELPGDEQGGWAEGYFDYMKELVLVIDRDTDRIIQLIDLRQELEVDDYLDDTVFEHGELWSRYMVYDDNSMTYVKYERQFDPETGKVLSTRMYDQSDEFYGREYTINDYFIGFTMTWDEDTGNSGFELHILSPAGTERNVIMTDPDKDYYDMPFITAKDSKTALIPMNTSGGWVFFELDLESASLTEADPKEYEWLDMARCSSHFESSDGNLYIQTITGIEKINFETKQIEQIFDYSFCDVNRSVLTSLSIADISSDKIVLCGNDYTQGSYGYYIDENPYVVIEFTKARSNPHAGKTILELYSAEYYDDSAVGEAIVRFNQTNKDCFIKVTDRYDINDFTEFYDADSDDKYARAELNKHSKLGNKLAIDILNGEGPDIIMNIGAFGQLCSNSYLADLAPYIGQPDSGKYYTNIIELSKTDGRIYNLPLCYTVEGIMTRSDYAGESHVGFTTEEYKEFIDITLNGEDVIDYGQAYYFVMLFDSMKDEFISNGKVDITIPEFAELAAFVKNNVREDSHGWDEYEIFDVNNLPRAINCSCFGAGGYLNDLTQLNGASAILGYPSTDGRGPVIDPFITVSVSASSSNVDACGEFVKILMSDEIQDKFAMSNNLVLDRNSLRKAGQSAVEYYNGEGYERMFGFGFEERWGRMTYSDKNLDDLDKIILTCSGINKPDPDIDLILIEEMPAYFSGQKDLQEVILIVQDRMQKVLEERK